MSNYEGPNTGLRIIEVGRTAAGAFCTKLFSDFGAEVIKVEPLAGDRTRGLRPLSSRGPGPAESGMHVFLGARKRSIALDLTRPSARPLLLGLLQRSDAVVDSRPFVPEEDDEIMALRHAAEARHVVWLRLTPFGLTGPWREWKGEDLVFQALAGGMYGWGSDQEPPLRAPGDASEFLTGAFAAAMLAAPLRTDRAERQGQVIDVSHAGTQLLTATLDLTRFSFTGAVSHRISLPFPGIMKCKDGYVGINLLTDDHWRKLCVMLGRPDLLEDERFATPGTRIQHSEELFEIFDPLVQQRTKEEFFEEGNKQHGIPISPVADPRDVFASEHLNARGFFQEQPLLNGETVKVPTNYIRMSSVSFAPVTRAPAVGEHTSDLLTELGVSQEAYEELTREEVAR